MDRDSKIRRGNEAKLLLENETLLAVFEETLQRTFDSFLASTSQSDDERLKLWSIGQALMLIKAKLDGYVDDATIERVNKEHDEKGPQHGR